MEDLKLIINGKNMVLDKDREISIEMCSPLFNDSGTFSYPFSVPFKENRATLGLLDVPDDDINLRRMRYDYELYFNGIMLLSGKAQSDSDTVEDSVDFELCAGNRILFDIFDETNLRDLPRLSDIDYNTIVWPEIGPAERPYTNNFTQGYDEGFVSCCINVITSGVVTNYKAIYGSGRNQGRITYTDEIVYQGGYRTVARLCPFLLYIFDSVISFSGYKVVRNDLSGMPVFNRIAVLNTKYDLITDKSGPTDKTYISNSNFPDISISDFLSALYNGFGVRMLCNEVNEELSFIFLKNVFKNIDTNGDELDILELDGKINAYEKIHIDPVFFRFTYDGSDSDTAYGCDLSSEVVYIDGFGDLPDITRTADTYTRGSASSLATGANKSDKLAIYDTNTYIVKNTGTRFRVKVNNEGYNPYYFEVDQFRDWEDDEYCEEYAQDVKMGFLPVINNLCETSLTENSTTLHYSDRPVFIDCEGTEQAVRQYEAGFQIGFLQLDEKSMEMDDVIGDYMPAFTADTTDTWGEHYNPIYNDNFSLRLDADNSASHIGLEGSETTDMKKRGLIDNFYTEYIDFMKNRKKVAIAVTMSINELTAIDWTRRYKVGQFTGLIDKISYSLSGNGIKDVIIEMYLI